MVNYITNCLVIKLAVDEKDLVERLKKKREELRTKLVKRRLDIGDQDSRNESRYITATRWAVEQEINSMDEELARLDQGIKEVESLIKKEDRFCGKYFITDEFECLELGIISIKTKVGKEMLTKQRML